MNFALASAARSAGLTELILAEFAQAVSRLVTKFRWMEVLNGKEIKMETQKPEKNEAVDMLMDVLIRLKKMELELRLAGLSDLPDMITKQIQAIATRYRELIVEAEEEKRK